MRNSNESCNKNKRRLKELTKLYEGKNANVEQELVADLVGDYLFTDADFIKHLSTEHRNLAQKIYDEIKYLCKVVTAGSKEARQLEKVKKAFADAYRAETKNPTKDGGVKFSFGVTQADIDTYVDNAYVNQNSQDYRKYAEVSEKLCNDVQADINLNGYAHALRDNDIRHIRNSHGENTQEKYPVTKQDIKNIPWIVENYDKVYTIKRNDGRTGIMYVKVNDQGTVYYLEQVTSKYGNEPLLVNKQMIKTGIDDIPDLPGLIDAITKKQSETEFLNDLKEAQQVYAQSVYQSHSINKVTQPGADVKQQFSLSSSENVKKAFADAYRAETKNPTAEGGTKYSLNKDAKNELHKALYDRNYQGEVLLRDESPTIMLAQKGVKNLPMSMKASHIRENVFTEDEAKKLGLRVDGHINYHGLGEDFFLKVIDGLDNVKEAYRGTKNADDASRRENYFLLVSEFTDNDGNIINVPVYINEHALYNRVFIDVNKVSTAFGRTNFRDYINRQIARNNLVRIKNRSNQTSESNAPIARDYGKEASTDSIRNSDGVVNSKNSLSPKGFSIAPPVGADVHGRDIAAHPDDWIPIRKDIPQKAESSVPPENTNAVSKPLSSYSAEKQKSIKAYLNAVDESIKKFAQRVKSGDLTFKRQKISDVSQRAADDIGNLIGADVNGYTHNINTNGMQHIIIRHGENGKQDKSMSLDDDIARIGWVLENYDNVELVTEDGKPIFSSEFLDKNHNPAQQIRFTKKIDGTYYVVEAAFENDYKKLWVQSAYLQKNEDVTQTPAEGTSTDHETNAQSAFASPSSNHSIPNSTPIVNPEDSTGAAPSGFDPVSHLQYEYGSLPEGEKPVREDSLPKSTTGKDKVSLTARTVKGAEATPDALN